MMSPNIGVELMRTLSQPMINKINLEFGHNMLTVQKKMPDAETNKFPVIITAGQPITAKMNGYQSSALPQIALRKDLKNQNVRRCSVTPPSRYNLTSREGQVLEKIISGFSNKETARKLGISPRTVEVHRSRIMEKLNARNIGDLFRIVYSTIFSSAIESIV